MGDASDVVARRALGPISSPVAASEVEAPHPERRARNLDRDEGLSTAKLTVNALTAWFDDQQVLTDIAMEIPAEGVTAVIGPSGCGKSTFIRILNRMFEMKRGARLEGRITLDGEDIYARDVDPVQLRRRVGMVFQRPNPFPAMSVRDNVLAGLRLTGKVRQVKGGDGALERLVRQSLESAALWDDVKSRLDAPGGQLSSGQQQRLCIARAIAMEPEVLLMDEPCSALDPMATARIEDLIHALKARYTIVIVTHNIQQAARVSDRTAFFLQGELVEYGPTDRLFTAPRDPRTEDYVTGKFG